MKKFILSTFIFSGICFGCLQAQRIAIRNIDANGSLTAPRVHNVGNGWVPININDNKVLWSNATYRVYLTVFDMDNKQIASKQYGPFAGWQAVNYSDDRILWAHDDGRINLWRIDNVGEKYGGKVYGPYKGWNVVNYSNEKILWVHDNGRIDIWTVDSEGNKVRSKVHTPPAGWIPINIDGYSNHILWEHEDGRIGLWSLDDNDNRVSVKQSKASPGFHAVNFANGTILTAHPDGRYIRSTVQYDGTPIRSYSGVADKDWRVINCSQEQLLLYTEKAALPPPPKPVVTVNAANAKEYYVKNNWTNTYLFGGQDFGCGGKTPNMSANNWVFLPVNGLKNTYQIRHKQSGNFLHIEKGFLDFGKIQSGWTSAQWILEPLPNIGENVYRIKNRLKPTLYLNNEKVSKGNGIECTAIWPAAKSAWWYLEGDE